MATFYEPLKPTQDAANGMTKIEMHLLMRQSPTYSAYYNGKLSYALHGKDWESYVTSNFPELANMKTSENAFKAVIDLYAENLVPVPEELKGFSNCVVPLIARGECVVVVDSARTPHFAEHYEVLSDGTYTIAAIFTRSLKTMLDYVTFAYSDGRTRMFYKNVPDDMSAASMEGFTFGEELTGNELFRFALDDKGMGASLAALQDRMNHSIIDQTVVAEMYARPFWYLLNVEAAPTNPYLPPSAQPSGDAMQEQKDVGGGSGRIFTTNSEGPFGQLEPPTIGDMIAYHDSIIDKIPQAFGIPAHYIKPGSGTPPTGVALKVLSKRFNNKVARMREDIRPELERLAAYLRVEKTKVVKTRTSRPKPTGINDDGTPIMPEVTDTEETLEYEFWSTEDDLLQESLDAHGISLSQMGYPLEYIAEVVTPGVDLDDYETDVAPGVNPALPGQPTDMTATGQTGLPATPGQVASYAQNPGQRKAGV